MTAGRSAAIALCSLLILVLGAAQSWAHQADAHLAPCAAAHALEKLGRVAGAEAAYLADLGDPATIGCAQQGLARLATIEKYPCASAEALAAVGERTSAHAAFLKTLEAKPASRCAARGAKATTSSTSVWSWVADATVNAGKVLTLVVVAAFAMVILALLLLHVQTRIPRLRDWPPASWIRRPALQIAAFDDSALSEHLGQSISGLVRGQVSLRKDRFNVNLVSGQAGVASALSELGGISTETSAAVAVINFLTTRLPRRRFVLGGELQPAGGEGAGLSLELNNQGSYEALITFWAEQLKSGAGPAPLAYQSVAVAAAAWVDHTIANVLGGEKLLTADPQSWAYFRCGLDAQRLGDDKRARSLYKLALIKDGTNVGALANLGIICRTQNEYENADWYLSKALKVAEGSTPGSGLAAEVNPDWYRIKHQLAAVYMNWAADREVVMADQKRVELKQRAISQGKEAAIGALSTLATPPARGRPLADYLNRTLDPFLEGTFVPSVLGLVACAVYPGSRSGHEKGIRPTCAEVIETLEVDRADQVDPWLLVRYVEGGDELPPNAQYELSCFYTLSGDFAAAAKWLRRGIRDAPETEQKTLIEVAEKDPTLEALREAQSGMIDKLKREFGEEDDSATVDRSSSDTFDFSSHVQDWFKDGGWSFSWMKGEDPPFKFCVEKDGASLLVEVASSTEPLSKGNVLEAMGKLAALKETGGAPADAEARIMVPREPAPAPDIDYAQAGAVGVKVEQSRDGTFQVLP